LILVQSSSLALAELVLNWLLRCWFGDHQKMSAQLTLSNYWIYGGNRLQRGFNLFIQ
jgi:hypothetical protein